MPDSVLTKPMPFCSKMLRNLTSSTDCIAFPSLRHQVCEGVLRSDTGFWKARGRGSLYAYFSSMSNKEFNKDVRELLIRTKVSTLLRDRPVVLLKQESTVELALQASPLKPYHLP